MQRQLRFAVGLLLCALLGDRPTMGQSWFPGSSKKTAGSNSPTLTSGSSINAAVPRRGADTFEEPTDPIVDPSVTSAWKYDVRSDAFQGQRRATTRMGDHAPRVSGIASEVQSAKSGGIAANRSGVTNSQVVAPVPQRKLPISGTPVKAVSLPTAGGSAPRLSHSVLGNAGPPAQQTAIPPLPGSVGQELLPLSEPTHGSGMTIPMQSVPPLPSSNQQPMLPPEVPWPSNLNQNMTQEFQPQRQFSDHQSPTMNPGVVGPLPQPLVVPSQIPGAAEPPLPVEHVAAVEQPMFWWEENLKGGVLRNRQLLPMSLSEALQRAMTEAPELKILHSDWYIQTQETIRQDAVFDWTTFVNGVWNRDAMPVGSTLDGAAQRLHSRTTQASAGIKRLDRSGGELNLSQQFGLKNGNSQFLVPNEQGNSRLALSYKMPLLRGFGQDYATGSLRLAELDKDIAFDRMQAGIQDHLLSTAQAYWSLVLARGDFLQKVTSWTRANAIAQEMATRVEIDVTPATLDRAQSEVANRMAQSIQAEHDVLNAQEVLLELIYASRYTDFGQYEVVTTTLPPHVSTPVDVESQAEVAVQARSEVHQAIREIRQATIQQDLSENEVKPKLDLVLTGYSAGLRPDYNIGQSFNDQFTSNDPGAGVGLNFEIPYRNRAAQAKAEQRRIAVARMQREFENIVGEVKQDVRRQANNRNKFAATLPQQGESLVRVRRLLNYSQTRRDFLADGARVGDLYLNDLLQIQNRLQSAEYQYLQTQVSFAAADNSLMRSVASLQTLAELPGSGAATSGSLLHHQGPLSDDHAARVPGP